MTGALLLNILISAGSILLKVVLTILVLILIFIFLVLFVPVKYRLSGEYLEKTPKGEATVSWLFGFLKLIFIYDDKGNLSGELKLLGIKIYDIFQNQEKG